MKNKDSLLRKISISSQNHFLISFTFFVKPLTDIFGGQVGGGDVTPPPIHTLREEGEGPSDFAMKLTKYIRISCALASLFFATNLVCANTDEAVYIYPILESPLLISEDSSPEAEMTGIAYELKTIPRAGGGNGKGSSGGTKLFYLPKRGLLAPEELEELWTPKKRTFIPVSTEPLTEWHSFLLGRTLPGRIIILPPVKKESPGSQTASGTQSGISNLQVPDSETETATTNREVKLRELSFLSVSSGSSISYAVAPIAEEPTGDTGTTTSSPVNASGIYNKQSGDIVVSFSTNKGNTNNPQNLWVQKDEEGYFKEGNGGDPFGKYNNPEKTTVVFDNNKTEDLIYIGLSGALTPKEVVIASGNYHFLPIQNGSQGKQDGGIGSPKQETPYNINLYVCKDVSLTLTDDNHHTGNTYIYGTVNLEGKPLAKNDTSSGTIIGTNGEVLNTTGKLGTGSVYVYGDGDLTIGSSHLNNHSLNIEGGEVKLGEPKIEGGKLVGYSLLQNAADNHELLKDNIPGNEVAIRLGANGTGGTLDLTGSWANGYYQLYSGTLTSTNTEYPHYHEHYDESGNLLHTDKCYSGKISGRIEIDIAEGKTLEIKDVYFTAPTEEVRPGDFSTDEEYEKALKEHQEFHTHTAKISSGGQLLLTGQTDIQLNSLDIELEKPADGKTFISPITFEADVNATGQPIKLGVEQFSIEVDRETLEDLIDDSSDGESKYQIVSLSGSHATEEGALSKHVEIAGFITVKSSDNGEAWHARLNDKGQLILLSEIPEPAAFALMVGLVATTLAGTRRRRKKGA